MFKGGGAYPRCVQCLGAFALCFMPSGTIQDELLELIRACQGVLGTDIDRLFDVDGADFDALKSAFAEVEAAEAEAKAAGPDGAEGGALLDAGAPEWRSRGGGDARGLGMQRASWR